MLKVKQRPLTVHDYNELTPEGPPYCQLIEGELHMSPSLNRYHQRIALNIGRILADYLDSHPIGEVHIAPLDVVLTDLNVFQPDILYVSNAHRAVLTDQNVKGAPDLVVEILSPQSAKHDLGVKRAIYARTGVEELWIVDPDVKRLMVYRLQDNAETPAATYNEKATFQSALFPNLTINTADLFKS
jgi:Uma2 family endonuclease